MRICKYKHCDKDIFKRILHARYCSVKHRNEQHKLNRVERYFIEEKRKIEERKKVIIIKQIPTRIIPQADRYQDLFIYCNLVMSNF